MRLFLYKEKVAHDAMMRAGVEHNPFFVTNAELAEVSSDDAPSVSSKDERWARDNLAKTETAYMLHVDIGPTSHDFVLYHRVYDESGSRSGDGDSDFVIGAPGPNTCMSLSVRDSVVTLIKLAHRRSCNIKGDMARGKTGTVAMGIAGMYAALCIAFPSGEYPDDIVFTDASTFDGLTYPNGAFVSGVSLSMADYIVAMEGGTWYQLNLGAVPIPSQRSAVLRIIRHNDATFRRPLSEVFGVVKRSLDLALRRAAFQGHGTLVDDIAVAVMNRNGTLRDFLRSLRSHEKELGVSFVVAMLPRIMEDTDMELAGEHDWLIPVKHLIQLARNGVITVRFREIGSDDGDPSSAVPRSIGGGGGGRGRGSGGRGEGEKRRRRLAVGIRGFVTVARAFVPQTGQ